MKQKTILLAASFLVVFSTSISRADAKSNCTSCKKLEALSLEYKSVQGKNEEAYAALQQRATDAIQSMDQTKKLTAHEVDAVVKILAVATPVDPSEAIVVNNLELIKTNQAAIVKGLEIYPKAVRTRVTDAIETALHEDEFGNNPAPKATPAPKKK